MPNQAKTLRLAGSLIVFLTAFLLIFAAVSISANAMDGADDSTTSSSTTSSDQQKTESENETDSQEYKQKLNESRARLAELRKERQQEREKEFETKKESVQQKLTEAKLKGCEQHQESINKNMDKIAEMRSKQIEVFNKISERTQAFYKDKGLTVANYDTLVSNVTDKKAAAEAAVEALKAANVDFKCDSTDPLNVTDTFKSARDDLRTAMKDYRTSIKDLIVAVKTAAYEKDNTGGNQ